MNIPVELDCIEKLVQLAVPAGFVKVVLLQTMKGELRRIVNRERLVGAGADQCESRERH